MRRYTFTIIIHLYIYTCEYICVFVLNISKLTRFIFLFIFFFILFLFPIHGTVSKCSFSLFLSFYLRLISISNINKILTPRCQRIVSYQWITNNIGANVDFFLLSFAASQPASSSLFLCQNIVCMCTYREMLTRIICA